MPNLTYEAYLDEVATLLTELHDLDDDTAIKLVMDAQEAEYFSPHDDHEEMRTLERAKQDTETLFKAWENRKKTQQQQQRRLGQQKQGQQRTQARGNPPAQGKPQGGPRKGGRPGR